MLFGRRTALSIAALIAVFASSAMYAGATTTYVNYTGQGFLSDGSGGFILNEERCGLAGQTPANDGGTGEFANWDGAGQPYQTGEPYLVWVLTANGASSATLYLPDKTVAMFNVGGTFKFASGWYNPTLLFPGNYISNTPVYASYTTSKGIKNVQLTVSHGCAPHRQNSAWCSPGYWKNTLKFNPNGWTAIGVDPTTAMFNGFVSPPFYANDLSPDQLLTFVLNNPPMYGGTLGTAGPYGLTAFNATGAYLTSLIPGYTFDPDLVGTSDSCPLDAHGNLKQ